MAAGNFGSPMQLLILLAIVLLLFGGKRLRNLGGDLGGAIKGFKNSMDTTSVDKCAERDEAHKTIEQDTPFILPVSETHQTSVKQNS